jgi:thymidylate synthase
MEQFKYLINKVLNEGRSKEDRTGTGTISVFGAQVRFNMKDGFPLLTLKKTHTKSVIHELLWFLKGDTNIKYLVENNVNIWNEWPYERYKKSWSENWGKFDNGERDEKTITWLTSLFMNLEKVGTDPKDIYQGLMSLERFTQAIKQSNHFAEKWGECGPIYGHQWTNWGEEVEVDIFNNPRVLNPGINQIQIAVDKLKNNPTDRGIIVNAWNVEDIPHMALRPCHTMFQFYAEELSFEERKELLRDNMSWTDEEIEISLDLNDIPKYKLSIQLYQRSADLMLGVPFNIASYSLLLHMVAQCVNMIPGEFVHTFGDLHIYNNHIDAARECLERTSLPLCNLKLNSKRNSVFEFEFNDIQFEDYVSHPVIKLPVAV